MTVKNVIISIDGILFNTQQFRKQAWIAILQEHHISYDSRFFIRTIDVSGQEMDHVYFQYYQQKPFIDDVEARVLQRIKQSTPEELIKPGAGLFLDTLQAMNLQVSLISRYPRSYIDTVLCQSGLPSPFAAIVSGDEVIEAHPQPYLFLKTMHILHGSIQDTVAIEHSRHGLHAAYLANIRSIFLKDIFTKHDHEDLIKYSTFQASSYPEIIDCLKNWMNNK